MDIAREFIKEEKLNGNAWNEINHVQLKKKMILLLELVDMKGKAQTEVYNNIKAKSLIKQKINFPMIKEPTQKVKKTQY